LGRESKALAIFGLEDSALQSPLFKLEVLP